MDTRKNFEAIIHDLKHSWYFRIYALFWLVFALAVLSCLIILGQKSTKDLKEKDIRVWVENATSVAFPQFHFRVGGGENQQILSYNCWHSLSPIQTQPCSNGSPLRSCFAVNSSLIFAHNNYVSEQLEDERIYCNITTINATGDTLLAFEIEGTNIAVYGGNSYASVWVAPNAFAWVMLQKSIYTPSSGPVLTEWERTLLYHDDEIAGVGQFTIAVIIGSFAVQHWDQIDSYTGWMAAGDIGGFSFLCIIVHTILMILIGICMPNDSIFLKKTEGETSHSLLKN